VTLSTGAAVAATGFAEADLNMRAGPGTGYAVVTAIPAGTEVQVFDCAGSWCSVAWAGRRGYSSRSYLDMSAASYRATPPAVGAEAPPVYNDESYLYYARPLTADQREELQESREEFREAMREQREDYREALQELRENQREILEDSSDRF
jgi:uncharacterized protein YgiM (DUF1202 family)